MALNGKCLILIVATSLLFSLVASSQISVTATSGTLSGNYPSLKIAFDAINFGIHQGKIAVLVTGSTTETFSAVLNASGGAANYSKLTITPTTTCTIGGHIAGPLVHLNGADSVTIDGRIAGTGTIRSLTIQNTYPSPVGTTISALFISNGAQYDTVRHVNLQTISQSLIIDNSTFNVAHNNEMKSIGTAVQSAGIVCGAGGLNKIITNIIHDFSVGITLVNQGSFFLVADNSFYQTLVPPPNATYLNITGSGHTITRNFIGGAGPGAGGSRGGGGTGISCSGAGIAVDSNIMTNINGSFTGIISAGNNIIGVNHGNIIGSSTDTGAIRGNGIIGISFSGKVNCQNNIIAGLTAFGFITGIASSGSDTATISNNIIGGNVATSLKNYVTGATIGMNLTNVRGYFIQNTISHLYNYALTTSSSITGINCTTPSFAQIQNNLINELHSTNSVILGGISVAGASSAANITVTGNVINNLISANTSSSLATAYGISSQGSGNTANNTIRGNTISNIMFTSTGSSSVRAYGINYTLTGNQVIRANSITNINSISGSGSSTTSGISGGNGSLSGASSLTIDSNSISFVTGSSPNLADSQAVAVQGIGGFFNPVMGATSIASNDIHDISSTATAGTTVAGINIDYQTNTNQLTISGNKMYNLNNSNSTSGSITGIMLGGSGGASGFGNGTYLLRNNMITLTGVSNTKVFGIRNIQPATLIKAYYNSIYIGGISTGNNLSAAFLRVDYAYTGIDIRNNLLVNNRTGGISGHYCIVNDNFLPAAGWTTSNHNNLYTADPSTLASWSNADLSFTAYKTASLKDSCSVSQLVDFTDILTGNLHLLGTGNNQTLAGKAIAGVASDIDGNARNPFPAMGADELTLPFQGVTISASGPTSFCPGGNVVLTALPSGALQWYHSGQPVPGAVFDTITVFQPGNYSVSYNSICQADTSNIISINFSPTYNHNFSPTLCSGQTYPFGTQQLSIAGIYTDTFSTVLGCDSAVTINLAVSPTYNHNFSSSICSGQSYLFGTQQISVAGVYTDTFLTVLGCDSTVTINLAVTQVNDAVVQSGDTLTSLSAGTYQWVYCDFNYLMVPGANSQSFVPQISANYAVVVSENGCTDTSDCIYVIVTHVSDIEKEGRTDVYPNPFTDKITVVDLIPGHVVMLIDMFGRRIFREVVGSHPAAGFTINTIDISKGVYILHVVDKEGQLRKNVTIRRE